MNHFGRRGDEYLEKLCGSFNNEIYQKIDELCNDLIVAWKNHNVVYICGNGGSAANALHISNDFLYGAGACGEALPTNGLRIEALTANNAVMTCLANDTGYENIFSRQLEVKANEEDILIVLSGSGNSSNVVKAIQAAKSLNMKSYSIVAFDGGQCKKLSDACMHFQVNDMQIAEDTQLIVGHMVMQFLVETRANIFNHDFISSAPNEVESSVNTKND